MANLQKILELNQEEFKNWYSETKDIVEKLLYENNALNEIPFMFLKDPTSEEKKGQTIAGGEYQVDKEGQSLKLKYKLKVLEEMKKQYEEIHRK